MAVFYLNEVTSKKVSGDHLHARMSVWCISELECCSANETIFYIMNSKKNNTKYILSTTINILFALEYQITPIKYLLQYYVIEMNIYVISNMLSLKLT